MSFHHLSLFQIVYSITDRASFAQVPTLIDKLFRQFDGLYTPIVLVGNKCDLATQRKVSFAEGMMLAKKHTIPFIETR